MKKLIVAIAALAMLTGSAYAAEWNFYGNARVSTFYTDVDDQVAGTDDATNINMGLQGNSRIGANVKVSDELSGRFEYGTGVNVRLLYGVWNFGAGTFLVGQDYSPIRMPYSSQVYAGDNGMGGWGELGSPRIAQLKLRFGGFQAAILAPNTEMQTGTPAGPATATATEVKLPQLAAKYIFSGDNWNVSVLGAYQTFDYYDRSVNSYVLGLGGQVSFGAVTLAAQIHGGENVGNLATFDTNGTDMTTGSGHATYNATTNAVVDNEAVGYSFVATYTFNDMISAEAGFGRQETELDNVTASDDEVQTYYLQLPITMAPGVIVVPEIGVVDYKEAAQDKTTYFGAKWQINF